MMKAAARATVRHLRAALRKTCRLDVVRYRPPVSDDSLVMGRHSYFRPVVYTHVGDDARVLIGSFCSIARGVEFLPGGYHHPEWVSTFPFRAILGLPGAYQDGQPTNRGDIVVGNDVWIGQGARVLSGVHVGDGAIIGAWAVVARNVRPYAVVVGNPAREVRRRFDDDTVEALLELQWWNWPMDVIVSSVPLLSSPNLAQFLAASGNEHRCSQPDG